MKKQPVDKSLVIVRDVEPEEEWSFSFITSVIQAKRDLHLKSASFSLVFLTETSFVFSNMLKRNHFFVGLLYCTVRLEHFPRPNRSHRIPPIIRKRFPLEMCRIDRDIFRLKPERYLRNCLELITWRDVLLGQRKGQLSFSFSLFPAFFFVVFWIFVFLFVGLFVCLYTNVDAYWKEFLLEPSFFIWIRLFFPLPSLSVQILPVCVYASREL